MKESQKKHIRRWSINTKLNVFAYGLLVLFSLLIGYLIFSLIFFCDAYNQIVKNITEANAYNLDFKEELDYSVYRMIAGKIEADALEEELELKNPYEQVEAVRATFSGLTDITTGEGNVRRLRMIEKSLNTLEKRIDEINETVLLSGFYDKNMERLDINIRILTELIQKQIQEYINEEAASLERVRLKLEERQKEAVGISFAMLAIAVGATGIGTMVISRSIAKPIQNLCKTTELVGKGNFTTRAEERVGDEVSILNDSFNSMIGQIGELVEHIKEEQHQQRVTELKLLQAQINPHFLYNTLDTIIWLAEVGKGQEVVSMVSSLSEFFRTVLSEGRDFIRIREEASHIRSYLEIQQFRYRDILEYDIEIPEELWEFSIIKLTLQPLIENALYHGIKKKRGKGNISIVAVQEEETLVFKVKDNGIGMNEETILALRKSIEGERIGDTEGGFGLANVNERIRLHYGDEYGISMESVYGEGTVASVKIPAVSYLKETEAVL